MEDINFWWYIILAIIYALFSRKRKKAKRPGSEEHTPKKFPHTFDDLLKEITGQQEVSTQNNEENELLKKEESEKNLKKLQPVNINTESDSLLSTDEQANTIYKNSVEQAESFNSSDQKSNVLKDRFLKDAIKKDATINNTFAHSIREDLRSGDIRKAIIYSEILSRKY